IMMLDPRAVIVRPLRIGVNVGRPVRPVAIPGMMVDQDGVLARAESDAAPAERSKSGADDNTGAEPNGTIDVESRAGPDINDPGIIHRNVIVAGIYRKNFDVPGR